MRSKYSTTSIAGLVGAIALAASEVPGIWPWLHTCFDLVTAIALAAVGYAAQDRSGRPPIRRSPYILLFLAALPALMGGCRVGGMGLCVSSPTFGKLGFELDGGMIGKGTLPKPPHGPLDAAGAVTVKKERTEPPGPAPSPSPQSSPL